MAFPSVSLLDSFQRAKEAPLSNAGKWAVIQGRSHTGEIGTGEKYVAEDTFPTEDGGYWDLLQYLSPAVSVEYRGGITSARFGRLFAALSEPGTAEKSGYTLKWLGETTAGKVTFLLEKIVKNTFSTLAEKKVIAIAEGDHLGLTVGEGKVKAWLKKGAGEWEVILEVADATFTEGYVGIGAVGTLHAYRKFEAGGGIGLSLTQGQAVTLSRTVTRALAASQGQSASVTGLRGRTFLLEQETTIEQRLRRIQRGLSSTQAQQVTMVHPITVGPGHGNLIQQGSQAVLARAVSRTLLTSNGQAVTLIALAETPAEKIEREAREEREREELEGVVAHEVIASGMVRC